MKVGFQSDHNSGCVEKCLHHKIGYNVLAN